MVKKQIVIEVRPKLVNDNLSKVNELLEDGWQIKKVVVCNESSVHYILEKTLEES